MTWFVLRRHPSGCDHWYEIVEQVRAFPLAAPVERRVCMPCSEAAGRALVGMLNGQRRLGVIEGMKRFAWWQDGVEYVGTCGTTLERAIEDLDRQP